MDILSHVSIQPFPKERKIEMRGVHVYIWAHDRRLDLKESFWFFFFQRCCNTSFCKNVTKITFFWGKTLIIPLPFYCKYGTNIEYGHEEMRTFPSIFIPSYTRSLNLRIWLCRFLIKFSAQQARINSTWMHSRFITVVNVRILVEQYLYHYCPLKSMYISIHW